MSTVERSIEVAAPAAAVWAVMEDLSYMPQLSTSTVSVDPPVRLTEEGQRFEQAVKLAGRTFTSTWTLLELDAGRCLRVEGQLMRGVRYGITQAVAPTGPTSSRLTFTMTYELPLGVLGRLAGRLGAEARALKEADEVMAGVKRIAELASSSPSPEPTDQPMRT